MFTKEILKDRTCLDFDTELFLFVFLLESGFIKAY